MNICEIAKKRQQIVAHLEFGSRTITSVVLAKRFEVEKNPKSPQIRFLVQSQERRDELEMVLSNVLPKHIFQVCRVELATPRTLNELSSTQLLVIEGLEHLKDLNKVLSRAERLVGFLDTPSAVNSLEDLEDCKLSTLSMIRHCFKDVVYQDLPDPHDEVILYQSGIAPSGSDTRQALLDSGDLTKEETVVLDGLLRYLSMLGSQCARIYLSKQTKAFPKESTSRIKLQGWTSVLQTVKDNSVLYSFKLQKLVSSLISEKPNLNRRSQYILLVVEDDLMAHILCKFVEVSSFLAHLKPIALVSSGNDRIEAMEKIRNGRVNLVLSSYQSQEGVDLPTASVVIQFHAQSLRDNLEMLQLRERCRKPDGVNRIFDEKSQKLTEELQAIKEAEMVARAQSLMDEGVAKSSPIYINPKTGLNMDSQLLLQVFATYCDTLYCDPYTAKWPVYEYAYLSSKWQCTIRMPMICPVRRQDGELNETKEGARESAIYHLCCSLQKAGVLSDYFTYVKTEPEIQDIHIPSEMGTTQKTPSLFRHPLPRPNQPMSWTLFTMKGIPSLGIIIPHVEERQLTSDLKTISIVDLQDVHFHQCLEFHMLLFQALDPSEFPLTPVETQKTFLFVPIISDQTGDWAEIDWMLVQSISASGTRSKRLLDHVHSLPSLRLDPLIGSVITLPEDATPNQCYQITGIDKRTALNEFYAKKGTSQPAKTFASYYAQKGIHLREPHLNLIKAIKISYKKLQKGTQGGKEMSLPIEICNLHFMHKMTHWRSCIDAMKRLHAIEHELALQELQQRIPDMKSPLLSNAMTHYTINVGNKTPSLLMALGEAFIKFAVSIDIYQMHPEYQEKQMNQTRLNRISASRLWNVAEKHRLTDCMILHPFSYDTWSIPRIREQKPRPTLLSSIVDCFKAIIGSVYLHDFAQAYRLLRYFRLIDFVYNPESRTQSALHSSSIRHLQKTLGYTFHNSAFIQEALTHPSCLYATSNSYQRLEFIGDAALGCILTKHLFHRFPEITPGKMGDILQNLVNNDAFAERTVKFQLHHYIEYESKLLIDHIVSYVQRTGSSQELTWGSESPKTLGDVWESVAGAIICDAQFNLNILENIYLKDLMRESLAGLSLDRIPIEPNRQLSEYCQKQKFDLKYQIITDVEGDAAVEILINGKLISSGASNQLRSARRIAANQALLALKLK
eukprot:TRINITY_DN8035_c0_g1_i1.p1 TRINITY_DN8035_c0_g1~~TRINITY_DN8035_c0_g1_i1.p1  ORF type:complete len:1184 (+),score=296.07 TRINITY_DN8035_c0_g1_i1:86-3637(+)